MTNSRWTLPKILELFVHVFLTELLDLSLVGVTLETKESVVKCETMLTTTELDTNSQLWSQ